MKDLSEELRNLSDEGQRKVLGELVELALERWRAFTSASGPIRYVDSVVGTSQVVDLDLPEDAFRTALEGGDAKLVDMRYLEPLAALQDDDLEWEEPVEYAYYAVYNFFRKYAQGETLDPWIIANQALASLGPDAEIRTILETALARAAG